MNKNYTLLDKRSLPDISSEGFWYKHSSGANILHLKNDDKNKVFNIIFNTPPYDDTGLPHIIEHCVLNGSEKYPLKDPFGALMKGSLVTFLNAITFEDKTMYPVASCNDKDFMNLVDVYLNSVFFPLIHERKDAFLQEGWHYDLESPDGELKYNGVVYNEMKGAYSDAFNDNLPIRIAGIMFPDTQYRFSPGGDPKAIPTLTYEKFKEFHKTHYHPSNSFIYFYGDMDIDKCFDLLDKDYLSKFSDTDQKIAIKKQKPHIKPVYGEGFYSISEGESSEGKNHLAAQFTMKNEGDSSLGTTLNILQAILMNTPASPLKKALLEQNICENSLCYIADSLCQPGIVITAQNSRYDALKLEEIIRNTLSEVVENGLDKKLVESCINSLEFRFREKDFGRRPKGLDYIFSLLHKWTYGKNPLDWLSPLKDIKEIKNRISNGERFFENLIDEYILKNNFAGFYTLKPMPGLQAKEDYELKENLQKYKNGLSKEEIEIIIEEKKRLTLRQDTPDTPEVLNTIPIVGIEDIDKKSEEIPLVVEELSGVKLLLSPIETDGIVYNNFLFDALSLDKEEIPVMGLLPSLLGKLDTENFSFTELSNELNFHLGGFKTEFDVYDHAYGLSYVPIFAVKVKAFEEKTDKIYSLIKEILLKTSFNNKDRIKTLISEKKAKLETGFVNFGTHYAYIRSMSCFSNGAAFNEFANGYAFYEYLRDLLSDFESNYNKFIESLNSVCNKLFSKKALILSVTSPENIYPVIRKEASALIENLHEGAEKQNLDLTIKTRNEAFIAESQVQYNVITGSFLKNGFNFDGALYTLSNVLSEGFLLQEIRVKGGAYGYAAFFNRNGVIYCGSYRDPHVKRTYDIYKEMSRFLRNFKPDEKEMLQYILGAVNEVDRPKTPSQKGELATKLYLSGITQDMIQKERDELLSTTAEKIVSFAPLVESCINENYICSFGGEKLLKRQSLFEHIVRI